MFRLLILLIIPAFSFSQEEIKDATEEEVYAALTSIPIVDSQYEFKEIVQLDSSYTKNDLYRNAKLYFANAFKSSKDVLQYDEPSEGKVIGKETFQTTGHQSILMNKSTESRTTTFTLEISCKDGKYKYRMYGFSTDFMIIETDGKKGEHIKNGTLTIDQAYERSLKGMTKKMERNLFMSMLTDIHATQEQIKKFMNRKPAKEDF